MSYRTTKGRIVYERKTHYFKYGDVRRILKSLRERNPLQEFVQNAMKAFIQSIDDIQGDFIPAFNYSLQSFFNWVKGDRDIPTYSRGYLQKLEAYKEGKIGSGESWERTKTVLIDMVIKMTTLIEDIKKYIEEQEE